MPYLYTVTGSSGDGKSRLISRILETNKIQSVHVFEGCFEEIGKKLKTIVPTPRLGPVGYVIDLTSVGCTSTILTLTTLLSTTLKHHDFVLFEMNSFIATDYDTSLDKRDSQKNSVVATGIHRIHVLSPLEYISKTIPKDALNIELEQPADTWCRAVQFIREYVIETDGRSTEMGSVVKTILSAINQNADNSGISMRVLDYFVRYLNMLVDRARRFLGKLGTLIKYEKVLLRSQLDHCMALITGHMRTDTMNLYFSDEQIYVSPPLEGSNPCKLSDVISKLNNKLHKWSPLDSGEKITRVNNLLTLLSLPVLTESDVDPDPAYCLTKYNVGLLVQIHNRLTLNIPVILQGTSGVGKTSLITYLNTLYGSSKCIRAGHHTLNSIRSMISEINEEDVVIVHFDNITDQASLDRILKIVTSRKINGTGISDNIKFVMELGDEKQDLDLHDLFCIVINIGYDDKVVKGILRSGIECGDVEEVVRLIEGLNQEQDLLSYRSVETFTKVYCWVRQVLLDVLREGGWIGGDDVTCLVISVNICYQSHYALQERVQHVIYSTVTANTNAISCELKEQATWEKCWGSVIDALLAEHKGSISKNTFLLTLLICLETNTPLFTDCSSHSREINFSFGHPLTLFNCDLLDCSNTVTELLRCYSECVGAQCDSATQGQFKQSVLVIDHVELLDTATINTLQALLEHRLVSIICGYNDPDSIQSLYGVQLIERGVTPEEIEVIANEICQGYENFEDASEELACLDVAFNISQLVHNKPTVVILEENLRLCLETTTALASLLYLNLPHSALLELYSTLELEDGRSVEESCRQLAMRCLPSSEKKSLRPVCMVSSDPIPLLYELERSLNRDVYTKVLEKGTSTLEIEQLINFITRHNLFLVLLNPDKTALTKFLMVVERRDMLYWIISKEIIPALQRTHVHCYLEPGTASHLSYSYNGTEPPSPLPCTPPCISISRTPAEDVNQCLTRAHSELSTKYSYLHTLPLAVLSRFIIIQVPQQYNLTSQSQSEARNRSHLTYQSQSEARNQNPVFIPDEWIMIPSCLALDELHAIDYTAETLCFVCTPEEVLQLRFNLQSIITNATVIILTECDPKCDPKHSPKSDQKNIVPSEHWDVISLPQYITTDPKPGYKLLLNMIGTSEYCTFLQTELAELYCKGRGRGEFALCKQWGVVIGCVEGILKELSDDLGLGEELSELMIETARLSLVHLSRDTRVQNLFSVVEMLEHSTESEWGAGLVEMVLAKQWIFERYNTWREIQTIHYKLCYPYSWVIYQLVHRPSKDPDQQTLELLSKVRLSPDTERMFIQDLVMFLMYDYKLCDRLCLLLSHVLKYKNQSRRYPNVLEYCRVALRVWTARPDLLYLAMISQPYIASVMNLGCPEEVNVKLVKAEVWELCRGLEWGNARNKGQERVGSYLTLMDLERARIRKATWRAECKARAKISSFKVEESNEISSLITSLQYLEMFCKLGEEFGNDYKGDITEFVKKFFGSDWFDSKLECLVQWVTVKAENTTGPIRSQEPGSPDIPEPIADQNTTSPDIDLAPIVGRLLSLLVEMYGIERCEGLVKQGLQMLSGDVLYKLLAYCYRTQDLATVRRVCSESSELSNSLLSALVLCEEELLINITDREASASCVKYSSSLSTLDKIEHVATMRVGLNRFSLELVELFTNQEGITTEEIWEMFAGQEHDYYSKISTLLCRTNNVSIKKFILRVVVEKMGLGAIDAVLSKIPVLNFYQKTADTEVSNTPDYSLCLTGYQAMLELVYPTCKLCDMRDKLQLSPVLLLLAYHTCTKLHATVQCTCIEDRVALASAVKERRVVREEFRDQAWVEEHMAHLLYLSHLLNTAPDNMFLSYFRELHTDSTVALNNKHWMGMPEDIFSILRDVLTEDWAKVKDKTYVYYVCPNNHPYGINNCGDPEQESEWTTCGCKIGGMDHGLLSTNRRLDHNYKFLTEEGHNLDPQRIAGVDKVREMDKCSTHVLWYVTHCVLMLRDQEYDRNADGRRVNLSDEISLDIKGVSLTTGLSHDMTLVFLMRVIHAIGDKVTKGGSSDRVKWEKSFTKVTQSTLNDCLEEREELERRLYEGLSPLVTQLFSTGEQTNNPDLEIFYNSNAWVSSPKAKSTTVSEPELPESNPTGHDHLQCFIQLRREMEQELLTESVPVKVFDVKEYLEYLTCHIVSDDAYDPLDNGLDRCYWFDMWRTLSMLRFFSNREEESIFEGRHELGNEEKMNDYLQFFKTELCFGVKKQLLGLVVEYFVLFAQYQKPGFLEAMPLCEALEFYLDNFPEDELRRRDEKTLKGVRLGQDENVDVLVGHLGYIIDALDN